MAFIMAYIKIFKLVLRLLPEGQHKHTDGWHIKSLDSVMATATHIYIERQNIL